MSLVFLIKYILLTAMRYAPCYLSNFLSFSHQQVKSEEDKRPHHKIKSYKQELYIFPFIFLLSYFIFYETFSIISNLILILFLACFFRFSLICADPNFIFPAPLSVISLPVCSPRSFTTFPPFSFFVFTTI